jgi:hypothetical protein
MKQEGTTEVMIFSIKQSVRSFSLISSRRSEASLDMIDAKGVFVWSPGSSPTSLREQRSLLVPSSSPVRLFPPSSSSSSTYPDCSADILNHLVQALLLVWGCP